MKCPDCGGSNVQRSSALYEQGVRTSEGQTAGALLTSRGTIGVGISRHQSRSASLAAQRNAPPEAHSIRAKAVLVGGMILMFLYVQFSEAGFVETLLVASVLVLLAFGASLYLSAPTDQQEAERRGWERQWYCRKCGSVFFDEKPGSSLLAPDGSAFVSPVLRPIGRNSRSEYIDRALNPVQRAAALTERDTAGLAAIKARAQYDGSFDPVALRCDLGIVSRLSSLNLIAFDQASDRFIICHHDAPRRTWWQRTFG